MQDEKALEREFDMLMKWSGIIVPPDLRAGAVAGYRELKSITTLLRQLRDAASEPSNVFSIEVIIRST